VTRLRTWLWTRGARVVQHCSRRARLEDPKRPSVPNCTQQPTACGLLLWCVQ
jgi:hypothetical protein